MRIRHGKIRAVLIALPLAIIGAVNLAASGQKSSLSASRAEPDITQAERALGKRDYASALGVLHEIIQKDNSNYRAWLDLGAAYEGLGKPEQAIDAYRNGVRAKPDIFESNYKLGLILAREHKPGAEEALRAAIHLTPAQPGPEAANAWIVLGHLLQGPNSPEALAAFRKAAELDNGNPAAYAGIGQILEKQSKYDEAEAEYKQALALDPIFADALVGVTDVYLAQSRLGEAENFLKMAVADHPTNAVLHHQLGRVLMASKKSDEAIAHYEVAIRFAPDDIDAGVKLAGLYLKVGQQAEAEDVYRALIGSHPKDAHLRRALAEDLFNQKRYEEAESEFAATLHLKPDWGDVYGELAVAAHVNQHYPEAVQALDTRAKYLPEIPISYYLRANSYDHMHDPKDAATNYQMFLHASSGRYPELESEVQDRLTTIQSGGK